MNCKGMLMLLSLCAITVKGKRIFQNELMKINKNYSTEVSINDLQSSRALLQNIRCSFAPGLIVGNRTRELQCCAGVTRSYNFDWFSESSSLTSFLETLRQWNCPQFEEQCKFRTFAFTEFSSLVYDYFCNYTTFVETCLPRVIETVAEISNRSDFTITDNNSITKQQNTLALLRNPANASLITMWENVIAEIDPSMMSIEELKNPCIGIAQYDEEEIHNGSYQEVINILVPSCELTWFGFSSASFRHHQISFWTGLTTG